MDITNNIKDIALIFEGGRHACQLYGRLFK